MAANEVLADSTGDESGWGHVRCQPTISADRTTRPMKLLNTIDSSRHSDLFDYAVVDQVGESLGTIHSMWNSEHTGELEFLGVKTGWLFGSNHVVPAEQAQIDESARTIQVPYLLAKIKDAPSVEADATISDEEEAEIYRYYGLSQGTTANTTATARTTETMATGLGAGAMAATTAVSAKAPAKSMTNTAKAGDDVEVALHEEQVKVGKRTVDAGSVRLRKVIRTEIVNQPVEIRHEEVVVERISADQVHAGAATSDFKDETIEVPLTREEVVVSKEAHVTGAVRLNKTSTAETQNVSETVRKEDVEVVRDGKTVTEGSERTSR